MAISPFYVGQTGPALRATIQDDSDNPVNLTGATFTLVIENTLTNANVSGAGTWSILNAPAGVAQYTWNSADTATPGAYNLFIEYVISGVTYITDPTTFLVKPI